MFKNIQKNSLKKIDGLNLVLAGTSWRNQAKAAIVGKILLKHDKLRQVQTVINPATFLPRSH